MSLLADKVVLVSGGTQGVGAAIARAAVEEGATVAVSGRREAVGQAFAAELEERGGRPAAYVAADVADVAQARPSSRQSCSGSAGSTAWSTPPGLTSRGSLVDTTPELFEQHVAVNLRAPFFLMQAAVQDMRQPTGTRARSST